MKKILKLALIFSFVSFIFFGVSVSSVYAFRFATWSDGHAPGSSSYLTKTASLVSTLSPNFTIFNGDLEDDGYTLSEITSWKTAVGALSDITFPVRGNHDNHVIDLAGWQAYFDVSSIVSKVGATNYVALSGADDLTYSFDYENSRFIGADVEGSVSNLNDSEIAFIDQRLTDAESKGLTHAFIYFHGPIYCIGYHCSATSSVGGLSSQALKLINVINKHPIVTATFHGHEHDLAWTHINSARVPEITGEFEQFVTSPSGGGSTDSSLKSYRVDWAAMINTRGFAAVDVSGKSLTINYYRYDSSTPIKTMTFTKGEPVPIMPQPTLTPTSIPATPTPLPPGTYSITSQVSSSSDDAEQKGSSIDLTSSDLELVTDGTTVQTIGTRFNNISIPKGAAITNAYLEFTVDETNTEATSLTFYGEAVDNASTFSSSSNVSGRTKTTAKTNWDNIAAWNTVGAKIQTPDISNIIQEIVNRAGWNQGNSLAIIVTGSGHRTAEAYDGSVTSAPKLVINYSTESVTPLPTSSAPSPTPSTPCAPPVGTYGTALQSINVTLSGKYKVWSRIMAQDTNNNSYYLTVDNSDCAILVGDNSSISSNSWEWVDYKDGNTNNKINLSLSSGTHVLKFYGREEGLKIDRVIVTLDQNCVPSETGDNCVSLPTPTPTPTPVPTVPPPPTSTPIPTSSPVPTSIPTSTPVPITQPVVATPTPIPGTGTVSILPLADVTVKASSPDRNYGSASSVSIDTSPIEITYMKFDLTSLSGKQIVTAKLRIRISSSSKNTQNVKLVDDNTWAENTIIYNTRPAFSTYITKVNGGVNGTYLDIDLTDIATAKLGGLLSFGLDANGNDGLDFYSKEKSTSSYRPVLVVTYN